MVVQGNTSYCPIVLESFQETINVKAIYGTVIYRITEVYLYFTVYELITRPI